MGGLGGSFRWCAGSRAARRLGGLRYEGSEFGELGLEGIGALLPFEVFGGGGMAFAGGALLEVGQAGFKGVDDLVEGRVGNAAWEDAVLDADFV